MHAMSKQGKGTDRTRASLELLYKVSRELTMHLDLRTLLQRILKLTLKQVGAMTGSILVLNERMAPVEGALAYDGRIHDHTAGQLADTLEHGLAGWAVKNRLPVLVGNTAEDERWLRRPEEEADSAPRSAIALPLLARERVVGVLTVVHPQPGHFSQDDLDLLTAIGEQAGIAVENARLYAAERERREFAHTLSEIARIVTSTLDVKQVLARVLRQLERVIEYDSASIWLVEGDCLRLAAGRGFEDEAAILGVSLPLDGQKLVGRVLAEKKVHVVEDVQQEEGWQLREELPEAKAIHGWIAAPLLVRQRAVGVLCVDSHEAGAYGEENASVLRAFADQAATAVVNARLFAERERQLQVTSALTEAARAVSSSLDLQEVLQRILTHTVSILQAESASLALLDEDGAELEYRLAWGAGKQGIQGKRLRMGEGLAGWVAKHDKPVLLTDVHADARFSAWREELTGIETRGLICVPLRVRDRVIGVLEALNPLRGEFSPDDVTLLAAIAGLAGTAIAHAQLFAETQSARQRYRGLFEDSADPILITDLAGKISDANHRAVQFLGVGRKALLGRSIFDLHEPQADYPPAQLSQMPSGESVQYESKVKRANGEIVPVEVHSKRIDIDHLPFQQWIVRDISERRAQERMRIDLTSMIFHDLRAPLGNIVSSLEMLHSVVPLEDEDLQSVLNIAMRSSRRLSRLLDTLLDVARLEAGQSVLVPAQGKLGPVILEAVEELRPVAQAKSHVISVHIADGLPEAMLDESMMLRVMINLVENAIKYTPSGGKITIDARQHDSRLEVRVTDNGPGIKAADQERIFAMFGRVSGEGKPKGLGLGLAFCRLAIEAHGGEISVESKEGSGSTFFFWLPLD
jgi:NtrC-family two-component system sensor histidine kinase KinB